MTTPCGASGNPHCGLYAAQVTSLAADGAGWSVSPSMSSTVTTALVILLSVRIVYMLSLYCSC